MIRAYDGRGGINADFKVIFILTRDSVASNAEFVNLIMIHIACDDSAKQV